MGLYSDYEVKIPSGTFTNKKGYVYVYTNFFRNADGNPRNQSISIGKLNEKGNKLIPNANYFKHFNIDRSSLAPNNTTPLSRYSTYSVGYTCLIHKLMGTTGLQKVLDESFSEEDISIIETLIAYMIIDGSAMSNIDLFMESHYCYGIDKVLTSQRISDLFAAYTAEIQEHFYIDWIAFNSGNDTFAYDITSISTYSENNIDAEYGYNRDKEKLPQINYGLISSCKTRMPVYPTIYNGSITDKTNLSSVIKQSQSLGIKNIRICMDGGFYSEKNIKFLEANKVKFIIGIPGYLKVARMFFEKYSKTLYDIANRTVFDGNYIVSTPANLNGSTGTMVVGVNINTKEMMLKSLMKDIEIRTEELETKRLSSKYETVASKKKYNSLFIITKNEEGPYKYNYKVDEGKIAKLSEFYGCFCIFSNEEQIDRQEILYEYRRKDIDEKQFYVLKNFLDTKRVRTHTKITTDGKLFVVFLALIIRNAILEQTMKLPNKCTVKRAIKCLENISVSRSEKDVYLTKALTKEQKKILSQFSITEEDLLK